MSKHKNDRKKPDGRGKINDCREVAFNPSEGLANRLGNAPIPPNHLQRKAEEMLRRVADPSTTPEFIQRNVSGADRKKV